VKTRWLALPFGLAFGFLLGWGHLADPGWGCCVEHALR
jgi:hypothetical protein